MNERNQGFAALGSLAAMLLIPVAVYFLLRGASEDTGKRKGRLKIVRKIDGKQFRLLTTRDYTSKAAAIYEANVQRNRGYNVRMIQAAGRTGIPVWRLYTRRARR